MKQLLKWSSRITRVNKNRLVTYGINQDKIINSFTYEEMVYFLLLGKRPSSTQATMLRAVILSHCSHGITGQSTLAVRMAADCRAPFLNAALGGFLVGSGKVHQGGLEEAMRELKAALAAADATQYVDSKLANKLKIFGFGHRFHSFDPRAKALMDLCKRRSFLGPYVTTAMQLDVALHKRKRARMNIEGAGGSILLDLGIPPEIASIFILIGRGPMFAAAYMERLNSKAKPFQEIEVFDTIRVR